MSSVIPISLKVNLDFTKLFFSWRINNDKEIPETHAKNTSIPEDLGRIEILLSDKTGTLTKNEMKMKRLAIKNQQITLEKPEETKKQVIKCYQKIVRNQEAYQNNVPDHGQSFQNNDNTDSFVTGSFRTSPNDKLAKAPAPKSTEQYLKNLLNGMAICNTVVPINPKIESDERILESASPDEIAYVEFLEVNRFK